MDYYTANGVRTLSALKACVLCLYVPLQLFSEAGAVHLSYNSHFHDVRVK